MNSILSPIMSLSLPVGLIDRNFRVLEGNKYWNEIFGTQRNEISVFDYFLPDDRIKIQTALDECLNTGSAQIELDFNHAQSSSYLWNISFDPHQERFVLVGQSLLQIRNLQVKYERMFQMTTDAVMLLDETGFADCNQATLEIFKLKTVSNFIDKHPADLSPEFQPDGEKSLIKADRMIQMAMENGRNFFEWTHRNSLGEDFLCEVLLSRMILNGKTYLQASVRDITERIKLQKEIDDSKAVQINAARMASLGEMAGGIAHEINNPLSIIRAQAEHMEGMIRRTDQVDVDYVNKSLSRIIKTCDRIGGIVRGLKQLSRDSSSDPYIKTDLISVIEQVHDLCAERLKSYQIDFQLKRPESNIYVECRPVEISQVILNLLNNSFDAVEKMDNAWIKIEVEKKSKEAVIKVVDSGNGIAMSVVAKLAQPFFTTKEVGKGTGLGLSISKRIIEKHQGRFFYDPKAPTTTFVFTLPLVDLARD